MILSLHGLVNVAFQLINSQLGLGHVLVVVKLAVRLLKGTALSFILIINVSFLSLSRVQGHRGLIGQSSAHSGAFWVPS